MEILYYLILFILGACFGSFVNASVWRIRENKSILKGRSMCTYCSVNIKYHDLVPIVSFLILRGQCRACKKPIALKYFIAEITTGLLFVIAALKFEWPYLLAVLCIIPLMVFIYLYDYLYKEILDRVTLLPALLFAPFAIYFDWMSWSDLLLGGVVGFGFFYFQYFISKGNWIGGGDLRLGLLMGVILGWPKILIALLLSYLIGAIVSSYLLWQNKVKMGDETPMGTYLVIGTLITLVFGQEILFWFDLLMRI